MKWRAEVKFLNDGTLMQQDVEAADEQGARAQILAETAPAPIEFLAVDEIPEGEE